MYSNIKKKLGRILDSNSPETEKILSDKKSAADGQSLVQYKVGFFLLCGALSVTASFLPLYLKQLGLKANELGTVMFFRQFGGFFGGVIAPYLAVLLPGDSYYFVFPSLFLIFTLGLSFLPSLTLLTDCPEAMLNITSSTHSNFTKVFQDLDTSHIYRSVMFEQSNAVWLIFLAGGFGFCGEIFGLATDSVQHGTTMKALGKNNSAAYGKVRAWAALGSAAALISTGLIVNLSVKEATICATPWSVADYHFVFYVFAFFAGGTLLNAVNFVQTDEGEDSEDKKMLMPGKDFRRALGTSRNLSWLSVVLIRSMFYGVSQGFLKWHMENIGASPALIGLSGGITTVTEFFVFFWTPYLIGKFGHVTLVGVGILSYAARFTIFSLITNPVFVLPVEILEGVMFACIWSAMVSHLSNQVPAEGQTQIQGLNRALCMLGMATGFLVSGALTQSFGASVMFLIFAGVAAISCIAFVLVQVLPDKSLVT